MAFACSTYWNRFSARISCYHTNGSSGLKQAGSLSCRENAERIIDKFVDCSSDFSSFTFPDSEKDQVKNTEDKQTMTPTPTVRGTLFDPKSSIGDNKTPFPQPFTLLKATSTVTGIWEIEVMFDTEADSKAETHPEYQSMTEWKTFARSTQTTSYGFRIFGHKRQENGIDIFEGIFDYQISTNFFASTEFFSDVPWMNITFEWGMDVFGDLGLPTTEQNTCMERTKSAGKLSQTNGGQLGEQNLTNTQPAQSTASSEANAGYIEKRQTISGPLGSWSTEMLCQHNMPSSLESVSTRSLPAIAKENELPSIARSLRELSRENLSSIWKLNYDSLKERMKSSSYDNIYLSDCSSQTPSKQSSSMSLSENESNEVVVHHELRVNKLNVLKKNDDGSVEFAERRPISMLGVAAGCSLEKQVLLTLGVLPGNKGQWPIGSNSLQDRRDQDLEID